MSLGKVLLLGAVQGIGEFLPLSSSGHLVIFQYFLGVQESMLFFNVLVHIATLGVVVIYLRKELLWMGKSLLEGGRGRRWLLFILLGNIPVFLVGAFLYHPIEKTFGSPLFVSVMFLLTAGILLLADRVKEGRDELGFGKALFIGIFQALSILPGLSRSGLTISGGILRGMKREEAFRFSFLLAIPALLGALAWEIRMLKHGEVDFSLSWLWGMGVAFIFGWVSLWFLRGWVVKKKLKFFSLYLTGLTLFLWGRMLLK